MAEPRLYQIELRHRRHRYEYFVFAENAEAAISAFGGEMAEEAARRGLLRAWPVPAEEGGEAMTRNEVLDAIENWVVDRLTRPAGAPDGQGTPRM